MHGATSILDGLVLMIVTPIAEIWNGDENSRDSNVMKIAERSLNHERLILIHYLSFSLSPSRSAGPSLY